MFYIWMKYNIKIEPSLRKLQMVMKLNIKKYQDLKCHKKIYFKLIM